jgi:NAD(P)-dependent dehydrogenase (short-subunit alcohol dehydrogenase family)
MSTSQDLFDVSLCVAMVTGAASGIGLSVATVLAESGAIVGMTDVDEENLHRAASLLVAKGLQSPQFLCLRHLRLPIASKRGAGP